MESQKSKKEINKDRFKLLSHSPISVKGNQVDGSLKRFPLFFLLLLPPFFLLFVQQSHSLHPQPPDLTYLNPILNLANANVDLFEGVCESFARYSVAETSTGGYIKVYWIFAFAFVVRKLCATETWHRLCAAYANGTLNLFTVSPYFPYVSPWISGKLFEEKFMRTCRCVRGVFVLC